MKTVTDIRCSVMIRTLESQLTYELSESEKELLIKQIKDNPDHMWGVVDDEIYCTRFS